MRVDRILDTSRTAVNVAGDLLVCVVMDRLVGGEWTVAEEKALAKVHEQQRVETAQDVIIDTETTA